MAGGRPTKYDPKYHPKLAKALVKNGATVQEVADELEVDKVTIYRWANLHGEFCNALKVGGDAANDRLAASLYERARGYTHDDVDIRVCDGVVVQTPIKKHYPPDVGALVFWLTNKDKANWKRNAGAEEASNSLAKALQDLIDPNAAKLKPNDQG
jgi:hypothetical protein